MMGTGGLFLRKLRAKVSDEPTGFVWVEKGKLAGSGYPASRRQVEWVLANGVNTILTLTPNSIPEEWVDRMALEVDHVPMEDHEAPRLDILDTCATYLMEKVEQGRTVLVHCLAGEGRTGCVIAAYLIKSRRLGAVEALRELRGIKPQFVERTQEKSVIEYAEKFR